MNNQRHTLHLVKASATSNATKIQLEFQQKIVNEDSVASNASIFTYLTNASDDKFSESSSGNKYCYHVGQLQDIKALLPNVDFSALVDAEGNIVAGATIDLGITDPTFSTTNEKFANLNGQHLNIQYTEFTEGNLPKSEAKFLAEIRGNQRTKKDGTPLTEADFWKTRGKGGAFITSGGKKVRMATQITIGAPTHTFLASDPENAPAQSVNTAQAEAVQSAEGVL